MTTMSIVRKTKGLTQTELAQKVGIYQSELSLFEAGAYPLPAYAAIKIAEILELKPEDLQLEYGEYVKREVQDGRDVTSV